MELVELDNAAFKLYNDVKESCNCITKNNFNVFLKLLEIKLDSQRYNEKERNTIVSKAVSLMLADIIKK